MFTPTQPAAPKQAHHNNGLFSDHYLNVTLPRRGDWQELASEAEPALQEISGFFAAYAPSNNEAQTETDLVRPVLRALGHDFEVQPALSTPDGTKRPDYVFYRDAATLAANKNRTLDEESLSGRAFAVGDAKYWDRPLDAALKGKRKGSLTNNPSFQISFYMRHAGMDWGILTNGRLWRLYHRDTAHKLDRFYEVDLQELVESGDGRGSCTSTPFSAARRSTTGRWGSPLYSRPAPTTPASSGTRSRARSTRRCGTSPRASWTIRRTV